MKPYSILFASLLTLTFSAPGVAQDGQPSEEAQTFGATADVFLEMSGEGIYRTACQGCHMPDGQGAEGAGEYPALANNSRLMAARYPLYLVVKGRGAMPSFAGWLNDNQIAEVVSYIQTSFGNDFDNQTPTVEDVAEIRAQHTGNND